MNKYQVVSKRVQGMYVAFDDFNTGLRNTVWLNLVTAPRPLGREGRFGAPPASAHR